MHRSAILIALIACSHNHPADPVIVVPDAPSPDSAVDASKTTVEIRAYGQFVLAAYRDGKGAWQSATSAGPNAYDIEVTNDYTFLAVCTDSHGGFDAEQIYGLATDFTPFVFCSLSDDPASTVAVSGTMKQPGSVYLGSALATGTTTMWHYQLDVAPDSYDLLASDGARMVLRRGLSITAAETEPQIDLTTEGSALESAPLTIQGSAADDTLYVESGLYTTGGGGSLAMGMTPTAKLAPASLLHNGDFQFVSVTAQNASTFHGAFVFNPTVPLPALDLPPRVEGVTFTADASTVTAAWQSLPTYADISFDLRAQGPTQAIQRVSATNTWVAATGATSLAFDTTAPGYLSAWHVAPTAPHVRTLEVTQNAGQTLSYVSGAMQGIGIMARAPLSASRFRARLP